MPATATAVQEETDEQSLEVLENGAEDGSGLRAADLSPQAAGRLPEGGGEEEEWGGGVQDEGIRVHSEIGRAHV